MQRQAQLAAPAPGLQGGFKARLPLQSHRVGRLPVGSAHQVERKRAGARGGKPQPLEIEKFFCAPMHSLLQVHALEFPRRRDAQFPQGSPTELVPEFRGDHQLGFPDAHAPQLRPSEQQRQQAQSHRDGFGPQHEFFPRGAQVAEGNARQAPPQAVDAPHLDPRPQPGRQLALDSFS